MCFRILQFISAMYQVALIPLHLFFQITIKKWWRKKNFSTKRRTFGQILKELSLWRSRPVPLRLPLKQHHQWFVLICRLWPPRAPDFITGSTGAIIYLYMSTMAHSLMCHRSINKHIQVWMCLNRSLPDVRPFTVLCFAVSLAFGWK